MNQARHSPYIPQSEAQWTEKYAEFNADFHCKEKREIWIIEERGIHFLPKNCGV